MISKQIHRYGMDYDIIDLDYDIIADIIVDIIVNIIYDIKGTISTMIS